MQGLCDSLVAQGRQKEAVEYLQTQQQTLEEAGSNSKISPVEVQLLLGKASFQIPPAVSNSVVDLRAHTLCSF